MRVKGIFDKFFDYGAEVDDDLPGLDLMDLDRVTLEIPVNRIGVCVPSCAQWP